MPVLRVPSPGARGTRTSRRRPDQTQARCARCWVERGARTRLAARASRVSQHAGPRVQVGSPVAKHAGLNRGHEGHPQLRGTGHKVAPRPHTACGAGASTQAGAGEGWAWEKPARDAPGWGRLGRPGRPPFEWPQSNINLDRRRRLSCKPPQVRTFWVAADRVGAPDREGLVRGQVACNEAALGARPHAAQTRVVIQSKEGGKWAGCTTAAAAARLRRARCACCSRRCTRAQRGVPLTAAGPGPAPSARAG